MLTFAPSGIASLCMYASMAQRACTHVHVPMHVPCECMLGVGIPIPIARRQDGCPYDLTSSSLTWYWIDHPSARDALHPCRAIGLISRLHAPPQDTVKSHLRVLYHTSPSMEGCRCIASFRGLLCRCILTVPTTSTTMSLRASSRAWSFAKLI